MGAGASSDAGEVDLTAPRSFVPVVVAVRSAKGLRAADWSFGGGGKSDPYVVARVGPAGMGALHYAVRTREATTFRLPPA